MNWQTAHLPAALYDYAVQNRALSRLGARALWGYDITNLHQTIASQAPTGRTLDIPCGGGLAVTNNPHHIAADISLTMLKRARRKTTLLLQTDIYALPFHPSTFDAVLTYNGLHCLSDPAAAITELTRVLRPGGTLQGTTLTRGTSRRHDTQITLLQHLGLFGFCGTPTDLHTWLTSAALTEINLTRTGAVTTFTARK